MILSFLCLVLVSCASTQLKPGAETVVASEAEPPADCKQIGTVESNTQVNVAHTTKNVLLNLLRNRAYEIGGNYVKIETETTLNHSGLVYKCPTP